MILFSDFDDTIYMHQNPSQTVKNIAAIKKWRAAGHKFCVTTGRSLKSVALTSPELIDLCDSYIVEGGTAILNRDTQIFKTFPLDNSLINQTISAVKEADPSPNFLYCKPNSLSSDQNAEGITRVRYLSNSPLPLEKIKNLIEDLPVDAFCWIDVTDDPNKKHHTGSKDYNFFIDFYSTVYDKSHAITTFIKSKNIPRENIITVGDSENDHSMLKDFNGFMIQNSILSQKGAKFQSTPSLESLINNLLN